MFNSKKNNESKSTSQSGINSVVSGTVIEGNIRSNSDIRFDGHLKGDLRCSEKVVLAANALVEGNINCKTILVQGKIEGDVKAEQQVHIMSSGVVNGNLNSAKLIIEDGAVFNGTSYMGSIGMNKDKHNGGQKSAEGDSKKISKAI